MKHLYFKASILFFSCLYSTVPVAQAQSVIPFQYYQSLIFIKAKVNGHKTPLTFLVNTGANKTVIDTRTAEMLKLPVLSEGNYVEGTAGTEPVSIVAVKQIQAGTAVMKNMEVSKRNLAGFVTLKGHKVDGILGTDFLQAYAMTVDFKNKKLSFTKPKLAVTKQKCIAFEMQDGIPRCSVTLDDNLSTQLNYNSGVSLEPANAVYVNVSQQQFADLKRINPYINQNNYITGKGVGGDIKLQMVKIPAMTVSNIPVKMPYLIVQDKEGYFKREDAIGFFGNNLLEKFKKVTIDFPNKRVVIEEVKNPTTTKGQKNKVAQL
jgi:hypothetical protein